MISCTSSCLFICLFIHFQKGNIRLFLLGRAKKKIFEYRYKLLHIFVACNYMKWWIYSLYLYLFPPFSRPKLWQITTHPTTTSEPHNDILFRTLTNRVWTELPRHVPRRASQLLGLKRLPYDITYEGNYPPPPSLRLTLPPSPQHPPTPQPISGRNSVKRSLGDNLRWGDGRRG